MLMKYSITLFAAVAVTVTSAAVPSPVGGGKDYAATDGHGSQNVLQPRIEGGDIVKGREFPWLVSLRLFSHFHLCVGNILSPEWILIGASCMFYAMTSYSIKAGTNKLDTGGTVHALTKIVMHEAYNESNSWVNDIALLKIHPPIELNEDVTTTPLVEKGHITPVGTTATIAGWGALKYSGSTANDLHKLDVLIYDKDKCAEVYASVPKDIYPTQICAESTLDRHGPTNGDSAAPLIVDGKVIALMSWQMNINELGWPFVSTDLASYIDWINDHMKE